MLAKGDGITKRTLPSTRRQQAELFIPLIHRPADEAQVRTGVDREEVREAEDDQAQGFLLLRAKWKWVLVHAVVKHEEELVEFGRQDVELVPLKRVLKGLCPLSRLAFMASADTDIADLIGYYGRARQLYVDDEKITLRITPSRILLAPQVVDA
jgi:hypothetical protein